jgi:hypothetical protein
MCCTEKKKVRLTVIDKTAVAAKMLKNLQDGADKKE